MCSGKGLVPMKKITKSMLRYMSPQYHAVRDVTASVFLPAGNYVIVPTTYNPGGVGKYWLSISATCAGVRVCLVLICAIYSKNWVL